MKGLILITCLLILFFPACTQSRYIQNPHAFYQQINHGTIAVDDKGNALTPGFQTNRYIYFECSENIKPKINEVIYNGDVYNDPSLVLVGQKQLQVGIKKSDNNPVTLSPAKGNNLWRIELTSPENKIDNSGRSGKNKIIIKAEKNRHASSTTINSEVELQPVMGL